MDENETDVIEETREDVEQSVRDEGRDEAAVTIAAIDSKLDAVMSKLGELMAKVEALPTFERAVDEGAVIRDEVDASAEVALPTSDLSDLDLSM